MLIYTPTKWACWAQASTYLAISKMFKEWGWVPNDYWVECILKMMYLIKWMPAPVLNNKTLFTRYFGLPPAYFHLWVFGYLYYIETNTYITKLDPWSKKGCFSTTLNRVRAIKCSKTTKISRDVLFQENAFPFLELQHSRQTSLDNLNNNLLHFGEHYSYYHELA